MKHTVRFVGSSEAFAAPEGFDAKQAARWALRLHGGPCPEDTES